MTGPATSRMTDRGLIRFDVLPSVFDVDAQAWDALVPADNFYLSHAWLRAMSRGWSGGQSCIEAAIDDAGLVGGLPLYVMDEPGFGPYDPTSVLSGLLRHPVQQPLYPFVLAGSRLGYRTELLLPSSPPPTRRAVAAGLLDEMEAQARRHGAPACGLLYLSDGVLDELLPMLARRGYLLYLETFEVRLSVQWGSFTEYLASLSAKRRNAVKRELALFDRSGLQVVQERQPGHEPVMARLLANVQRRYGNEADETALERSLMFSSQEAGSNSVLFLLKNDTRVIGYCLAYRWREHLFLRSAGFDYTDPTVRGSYFQLVLYEPVRHAIEQGLTEVHMGTEAFEAKVGRGGHLLPLWSAFALLDVDQAFRRELEVAAGNRLRDMRSTITYPPQVAMIDQLIESGRGRSLVDAGSSGD